MKSSKLSIRLSTFAAIGVLLVGGAAGAATYSMTGKAATGSGAFVDLPAKGNAACPSIAGKIGFGLGMYPQTKTNPASKLIGPVPHNPGGCIPGGPAKVTTTAMGGFLMPVGFFNQPFPGGTMGGMASKLNVSAVPNVTQILQLATSFKFEGPLAAPFSTLKPVNMTAMYAPWRKFADTAWDSQTGRIAKNFTACAASVPANVPCVQPSSGLIPAIVKNIGGPGGGFGGTMGLVLTTSPTQASSLAVKAGAGMTVAFVLRGRHGLARGRSRLCSLRHRLPAGRAGVPELQAHDHEDDGVGASHRVGHDVHRDGHDRHEHELGLPVDDRPDHRARHGRQRHGWRSERDRHGDGLRHGLPAWATANIQLVAGGVAQSNIQGPNGTPNYTVMRLPEPGAGLQLAAGAAALLAIAVWRGRKAR